MHSPGHIPEPHEGGRMAILIAVLLGAAVRPHRPVGFQPGAHLVTERFLSQGELEVHGTTLKQIGPADAPLSGKMGAMNFQGVRLEVPR